MALEKINLAEFNFDVEAVVSQAAETRKAIEQIKNEQKELVKQGKSTDDAFVKNAVTLRGLNRDYNAQLKIVEQVMNATGKAIPIQQRIDAVMAKEATTIEELRAQNSELTKIRNQVNISTEEGAAQLAVLNAKLDDNNDLIKENVSELEQQKIGIGGYTDAIMDAFQGTGLFDSALNDLKSILTSLTPVYDGLKSNLSDAVSGFKNVAEGTEEMSAAQKASTIATNLTSSSLKLLKVALIGTGIGAIVVLLGSLVAYLQSSEQASNKFSKVLAGLGGIVKGVMRALEPLGELVLDVIVVAFEKMGSIATATFGLISKGLRALGFDNAADSVDSFSNSMSTASKQAQAYADAQAKADEAQRKYNITQLEYQKRAERLRQIRDDESKSAAERIQANEDLGKVLQEQIAAEQQLAATALAAANIRIAAEGRTKEALDQQAEAMERMVDIQERVEGQISEQMTNRISIEKEAADKAKEIAQRRVDQMNQELELYRAQQSTRAMTLEQQIKLEEDIAVRSKKILDQQLKSKLISQTEYNTQILQADAELAKKRMDLAQENLSRELSQAENKVEVEKAISTAVGKVAIDEERKRATELKDLRAAYETERFEQGITSETEYQDAIAELNHNYRLKEIELDKQMKEALKAEQAEQAQLDYDTAIAALEARNANEYEIRQEQINQQRDQELAAARQKYTDSVMLAQAELLINQQADNAEMQLEKQKNDAILQSKADLAGSIADILGQETVLGKAAAIAQSTINTYQGATKALATLPPPASYIAAAATIATGLKSVASIVGVSTVFGKPSVPTSTGAAGQMAAPVLNAVPPFATGGKVRSGVRIRRSNGDNVLATLRLGEVVLNETQQLALGGDATFRAIGVPGFATGGSVGSIPTVQNSLFRQFDDVFVNAVADAVRSGSRIGTEQGSRQGIGDLSTENYLRNLSSV